MSAPDINLGGIAIELLSLVQRFVSPFQVKLRVAGKVEAHRAAVQMVWDVGSNRPVPGVVDVAYGSTACPALRALPCKSTDKDERDGYYSLSKSAPIGGQNPWRWENSHEPKSDGARH